jgi:uncharacterized membrane protein YdjX (TVP38/TMEM64 family)
MVILAVLAALVVAFFLLDLGRFLTLASLKANRDALRAVQASRPLATAGLFILVYVVQTALSLPGAAILSLAAGAIFGVARGTLFAVTGASLGAVLAFLVSRYLFREAVARRFGGRMAGLDRELERSGLGYLLFLRLVPLFPFFLVNLAAGLTAMRLSTYVLGTVVGIIPGGFVYVNAGAGLARVTSLADVASPRVLGAFALLGLFALVPVIYRRLRARAA